MVSNQLICSDWKEDLFMYNLKKEYSDEILKNNPDFNLEFINCPNLPKYNKNASIYFGNRVSEEILKKMPKIKWVHFGSIGTEKLSKEFIKSRKLTITNSRGTMESAVASSALSLLLSLSRGINLIPSLEKNKNFNRKFIDQHIDQICDVMNREFSILGFGPISQTFIKMISGFSGKIKVLTRTKRTDKENINFFELKDYKKCLKGSKFIVNFLPHTKDTNQYVNEDFINNIDKNSIYINVGRHTTNDELQLIKSVKSGKLSGVGLDVFDKESIYYKEMLKNSSFILTPHIASISKSYWRKQIDIINSNLSFYKKSSFEKMSNLIYLEGDSI